MRIISDLAQIEEKFGFAPVGDLTAPRIALDAPKMRTPVMAETENGPILLAREQELGNLECFGIAPERLQLFEQYVNFDNMVNGSQASASLAEAISELAGSADVIVEADLPYGRLLQIEAVLGDRVTVERNGSAGHRSGDSGKANSGRIDSGRVFPGDAGTPTTEVVVYRITADEVLERFQSLRRGGSAAAEAIIDDRGGLDDLKSKIRETDDSRFALLDATLDDLGAGAVLLGAPPNVSELTGRPPVADAFAFYARGADEVFLLAPITEHGVYGDYVGRFSDLAAAATDLADGASIAVEEGWIRSGDARELADADLELIPASVEVALWREERDHEWLALNIIASQASRHAIDGALEFAQDRIDAGDPASEREIYRRYLDLIHDFRRAYGIRFAIEPFFASCFAGDRTTFPGRPTDHLVTQASKTLKIDAGVKVVVDGVILGTSDLCRTLVHGEEVRRLYEEFTANVRDDLIGALRPGVAMSDAHRISIDRLAPLVPWMTEVGLMPEGIDLVHEYRLRNVGHLMGKQESFTTEIKPGHSYRLKVGAYGAAEIQWPYEDVSIGAEEMWYVGPDRTYILSL